MNLPPTLAEMCDELLGCGAKVVGCPGESVEPKGLPGIESGVCPRMGKGLLAKG